MNRNKNVSGRVAASLYVIAAVQVALYLLALRITAHEAQRPAEGIYPLGLNGASLAFILLGIIHITVLIGYLRHVRRHGIPANKKVLLSFGLVALLTALAPIIFTWVYDSNSYLNDYMG